MIDNRKKNILIIAEGYEEKPYIDKILSFPNINKDLYNFAEAINVKGNGNIPAKYQFELQRGFYDLVLIFADADKGSSQFLDLVYKIGSTFFCNKEEGFKVFIFANPVTLQIVLSHFGEVNLSKVSKARNAKVVEELTGIKGYNASQEQIKSIIDKITFKSLPMFKERLEKVSTNFNDLPSTNFLEFLDKFESIDSSWVEEIRKLYR